MASSSKRDLRTFVAERFDTIAREPAAFQTFAQGIGTATAPSRILAKEAVGAAANVLDVGCGPGVFLETLRDDPAWSGDYTGADTSPAMIAHAQRAFQDQPWRTAWRVLTEPAGAPGAAVRQLPFEARSFDAVVCRHVLEHLDRPLPLLAELVRVCRKTLVLVFSQAPLLRHDGGVRLADQYLDVPRFAHLASVLLAALEDFHTVTTQHDPRNMLSASGAGLMPREAFWKCERAR